MTEQQRFTKLYKFLFEDPTYNELPAKAKLLYALLTERQNLSKANVKQNSIQSQFIDEDGRLFSIYSNKELTKKLNMSEPTVIKLKKQLIEFDLLEEVRLGRNQSNRLYPKKPYDEYFYAYDTDEFYRLPHALFVNSKYKNLKSVTIIAYAIYLNRYEYSLYKQHFIDENNDVYCYFSNDNMAKVLGVSTRKVEQIKKELVATELMINKTSSFGKTNKLYIKAPKTSHSTELKKIRYGNLKKFGTGTKKFSAWELKKIRTSYIYFSYTYSSDIDSSDMNDMNEDNILDNSNSVNVPNHSDHSNHNLNSNVNNPDNNKSKDFSDDTFDEFETEREMLLQQLPKSIQLAFKHFDLNEIRCIKSVLNKAKANYNANVTVDERLTYEDCEYKLSAAIKRMKLVSRKKSEDIFNLEGYMMKTFKSVFEDYIREQQAEDEDSVEHNTSSSIADFEPKNDLQEMAKRMFMNHY
ncbi:Replication initiator protein A (RepA) N-terminus [Mycobacteroides abscessus subsp. abscessus]|nr:Replication initiator protein A (RepA) N-terminus [Mycobacteroides abscessus subsp. abscessus]